VLSGIFFSYQCPTRPQRARLPMPPPPPFPSSLLTSDSQLTPHEINSIQSRFCDPLHDWMISIRLSSSVSVTLLVKLPCYCCWSRRTAGMPVLEQRQKGGRTWTLGYLKIPFCSCFVCHRISISGSDLLGSSCWRV
jgi:hypothetical protein